MRFPSWWMKNFLSRNQSNNLTASIMRGSLLSGLLVASISSFFDLTSVSPFPVEEFLDIWILVLAFSTFLARRGSFPGRLYGLAIATLIFGLAIIVIAVFNCAPWFEVGQSYRWLFYSLTFLIVASESWGSAEKLVPMTWLLLAFAVTKVLTVSTFYPGEDRPALLVESNFELALFVGLAAVVYRYIRRGKILLITLLGLVVLLENSRSGAVAFFLFVIYSLLIDSQEYLVRRKALRTSLSVFLMGAVPFLVFVSRDSGLPVWRFVLNQFGGTGTSNELVIGSAVQIVSRADRAAFFRVFRSETAEWNLWNWIFGTLPVTPLSPRGCEFFEWSSLTSSRGDGSCYSVVFHSFLLRVTYDAGLLGLLFAFAILIFSLRAARVPWPLTVSLVFIVLANSLSVSGLNSPFVAVVVILAALHSGDPLSQIVQKPIPANKIWGTKPNGSDLLPS